MVARVPAYNTGMKRRKPVSLSLDAVPFVLCSFRQCSFDHADTGRDLQLVRHRLQCTFSAPKVVYNL